MFKINDLTGEDEIYVDLIIPQGNYIEAKVDTDTQVNILHVRVYYKLFEEWRKYNHPMQF